MSNAFIQTLVILLREGLEAMLVLAALASYLTKSGSPHRVRALYWGALAAVLASFVAAWIFAAFYGGEHNDTVEGVVILMASGLMIYVSGWLMVKQDPRSWQNYLSTKADAALSQGTDWAVAMLAFLAVFREGAETVLFVSAVAAKEGWTAGLFAGLVVGAAALAVLFYFINMIAQRLPLRPVFTITSALLFVIGVKFIGDALVEFQEQQIIPFTEIKSLTWLHSIGLNPTAEALSIQFLVILAALAAYSVVLRDNRLTREFASKGRPAE